MPRELLDEPFKEGFADTIPMYRRTPMPRYTQRTDALRRVLVEQAQRERIDRINEQCRRLGPVTQKAQRFDFGRKAR